VLRDKESCQLSLLRLPVFAASQLLRKLFADKRYVLNTTLSSGMVLYKHFGICVKI
jgi:hypothetical protein